MVFWFDMQKSFNRDVTSGSGVADDARALRLWEWHGAGDPAGDEETATRGGRRRFRVRQTRAVKDPHPVGMGEGCQVERAQAQPGGGVKPPISFSSIFAKAMQVRSAHWGPTICTPTGRPSAASPAGATVEGR